MSAQLNSCPQAVRKWKRDLDENMRDSDEPLPVILVRSAS